MPITITKGGSVEDEDLKQVELRRGPEGNWSYEVTYPKGDGSSKVLRTTPESELQSRINLMWDHLKAEAKTKISEAEGL